MTLSVGVNALFLHYRQSGTGRYLEQIIDRLQSRVDLTLLGSAAFAPAAGDHPHPVTLLRTPFDGRSRPLAKMWFEQVAAPAAMGRSRVALSHCPYFAAPVHPVVPTVVTVHDLATVLLPEYRRSVTQRLYASLVSIGLRSARGIITDSAASARDLVTRLRVPVDRIRVIPLAVDERFRPLETDEQRQWAAEVQATCGVTPPYLLYVGSFELRKNLERLVAAFATLKRERRIPHQLLLVGGLRPNHPSFYDPRPVLERLHLVESVKLIGSRSDDEVIALHQGADAFVFASTYEGFGLPPLEAMACGTPVICSRASSLPEVVGDAGILFDPTDVAAIADAIGGVVGDPELRAALGRRGRERAGQFTWEATADATLAAYRAVVEAQT